MKAARRDPEDVQRRYVGDPSVHKVLIASIVDPVSCGVMWRLCYPGNLMLRFDLICLFCSSSCQHLFEQPRPYRCKRTCLSHASASTVQLRVWLFAISAWLFWEPQQQQQLPSLYSDPAAFGHDRPGVPSPSLSVRDTRDHLFPARFLASSRQYGIAGCE